MDLYSQWPVTIAFGSAVDRETGLVLSIEACHNTIVTEGRLAGVRAFNEVRPPRFRGR